MDQQRQQPLLPEGHQRAGTVLALGMARVSELWNARRVGSGFLGTHSPSPLTPDTPGLAAGAFAATQGICAVRINTRAPLQHRQTGEKQQRSHAMPFLTARVEIYGTRHVKQANISSHVYCTGKSSHTATPASSTGDCKTTLCGKNERHPISFGVNSKTWHFGLESGLQESLLSDIFPSAWAGRRQSHRVRVPPSQQTGTGMQAATGTFK